MRLGEMVQKQFLEACHSSGKSVAFSCFGSIKSTISTIDARRKNVSRYDRAKKLRAVSHLWVIFWLNLNLQNSNLASQKSYGEENLKRLIQDIGSKAVQIDFAVRHTFEWEITFWLKSNLQNSNLASRETYGEENLKQLIQYVGSKAL